eukprot:151325-Chlamydomonas_euryale.AAC.15
MQHLNATTAIATDAHAQPPRPAVNLQESEALRWQRWSPQRRCGDWCSCCWCKCRCAAPTALTGSAARH